MSLAPVGAAQPASLADLLDAVARRTGGWLAVERLGVVVAHGVGSGACPAPLAEALLAKRSAPLRGAVSWVRGGRHLQGTVAGATVTAVELGDGATGWFVGGPVDEEVLPLLRSAVHDDPPVTDAWVEELLHPRGPARGGRAPQALLVVLLSDGPLPSLATAALSAVAATDARVHTDADRVVVALPETGHAAALVAAVRERCPDATAGVALVPAGAADWTSAARIAAAAARTARALGLSVADSRTPRVAAELVVDEACDAAALLVDALADGPLCRLEQHDTRTSGELVATVRAWCAAGGDVAAAAGALHVHTNTLRYRLRRAAEISGLDLDRPRHVLALQLLVGV